MEITESDQKMLATVHDVFYQSGLIKNPNLAQLGLQFTQFMQRLSMPAAPVKKQELFPPKPEEKKEKGK